MKEEWLTPGAVVPVGCRTGDSLLCSQYESRGNAMKHIKTWSERCEEHPDHQQGMISEGMIRARMQEEIDELDEEENPQ